MLLSSSCHLQQLEGARRQQGVIQGGNRFGILALPGDHVDPGPFLHRHQPFHFQHDDGFAHHGATHVHLLGNQPLGRQTLANLITLAGNALFQLGGDFLIETL